MLKRVKINSLPESEEIGKAIEKDFENCDDVLISKIERQQVPTTSILVVGKNPELNPNLQETVTYIVYTYDDAKWNRMQYSYSAIPFEFLKMIGFSPVEVVEY